MNLFLMPFSLSGAASVLTRKSAAFTAGSAVASVITSRSLRKTWSQCASTAARRSGGMRAVRNSQNMVGWLYQGLSSDTSWPGPSESHGTANAPVLCSASGNHMSGA